MNLNHYLGGMTLKNYGFKINKLILRGFGKKDAELQFNEGLNVISGASNTGKSYIFQCLNYILGGKDKPKSIKESKDYKELLLEIEPYNSEKITVKRNLTDGKMFIYDCEISSINMTAPKEIINQHDKENPENISTILLNLCNSKVKNVIKNNKNKQTESFTYRSFAHLTMLDEHKIIEEKSPIYDNGGFVTKPKNENAFKAIISGIDEVLCENTKKDEVKGTKIEAQLELIDEMIINTEYELASLQESLVGIMGEEIELTVEELRHSITNKEEDLQELEKEREKIWKELQHFKSDKLYHSELCKRFELLKENYESDYERLEFIDEAEYYLNQLVEVRCPLCHGEIKDLEHLNGQEMKMALSIEREKIKLQLFDLISTVEDTKNKIEDIDNSINEKTDKLTDLENAIENDFKPIISDVMSKVERLLANKYKLNKIEYLNERVQEMQSSKIELIRSKGIEKVVTTEVNITNDSIYNEFCKIIGDIFEGWKYKINAEVTFDEKTMDLFINGDFKRNFGKGHCAIINSAFVIGLMLYATSIRLPHPKVVILDSPLITFKDKDKATIEAGEKINDEVKQSFYTYLSKINKGVQIIILDNVEPNDDIKPFIKHYHFTGNPEIERTGFIPEN